MLRNIKEASEEKELKLNDSDSDKKVLAKVIGDCQIKTKSIHHRGGTEDTQATQVFNANTEETEDDQVLTSHPSNNSILNFDPNFGLFEGLKNEALFEGLKN